MAQTELKWPVSAVVITRNSEQTIGTAVRRLSWCQEIIVVDDASSDTTVECARDAGARVLSVERGPRPLEWLHLQGFRVAKQPWILKLDDDEIVTPNLAHRLQSITLPNSKQADGYLIARSNIFMGRHLKFGGMRRAEQMKFFMSDKWSRDWNCAIHSQVPIRGVVRRIRPSRDRVIVHPLYESFGTFLDKSLVRYAYQEADQTELLEARFEQARPYFIRRAFVAFLSTFVKRGILRLGFLDGWQGLLWVWFLATYRAAVVLHTMDQKTKVASHGGKKFAIDVGLYNHR